MCAAATSAVFCYVNALHVVRLAVVYTVSALVVVGVVRLVRFHGNKHQHHSDTVDNHVGSVVSFDNCAREWIWVLRSLGSCCADWRSVARTYLGNMSDSCSETD